MKSATKRTEAVRDVRTNVVFKPHEHRAIVKAAKQRGVSFAQVIRDAVRREILLDPDLCPFFNPPVFDGKPGAPVEDLAKNHDHYLYGSPKK